MPGDNPHQIDVRFVGVLSGRYTLLSATAGQHPVYACRTQSLSPTVVTIAAPVIGEVGQKVTLLLDHLGFLKGSVRSRLGNGFQVDIAASASDRVRLAGRIEWLKRHHARQAVDKRASPRRLPRHPAAVFTVDAAPHECFIIDYSAEGAGISAKVRPPVGTALVLGSIPGRVVRHMETGFGMRFDAAPEGDIEAAMAVRPPA